MTYKKKIIGAAAGVTVATVLVSGSASASHNTPLTLTGLRSLVGSLHGAIDVAYVQLYNRTMDLRYHDHSNPAGGSNDGGQIPTAGLRDGAVTTAKLGDGTVTSEKLAAGVLDGGALNAGTVTTVQIADGTIVDADISALAAIADTKLATIATAGKVADTALSANVSLLGQTIDGAEITDGAIADADISATAAIADTKLATIAAAGKVADTALSANVSLLGQSIDGTEVVNGSLGDADISATAAIADTKLATIAAAGKVADTALSANVSLLGQTIDGAEIVDGAIADADISATAAIADSKLATIAAAGKVADTALSGNVSKLGSSIESGEITDGTISNTDISATAAIADSKLATIAAAGKVADTALSANVSLLGQTIDGAEIVDGAIANADISATAAIADSKLATIAAAGKVADTALSANVSLLGQTIDGAEIVDGTIADADISATAAIADSKLATIATAGKVADTALSANVSLLGTSIDSAEVADGTIADADIAAAAAIADTKLATIATAGKVADTALSANVTKLGSTIESSEITDGTISDADVSATAAISAAKLATAARTHTVAVQIGDVALAASSTLERPVFVAPVAGTITAISFTNATSVTGASGLGTLSVERRSATAATVDTFDLLGGLTGFTAARDTTPVAGTTFAAGDVYSFKYVQGATGQALDELLVTVEYTVN